LQASSVWNGGVWPLAAGSSWKAYLLRDDLVNSNGGSVTVAASATFTIASGSSGGGTTATALSAARSAITAMIIGQGGNKRLGPMFLRLGFHDCIGGCDGCVDLTNPENAGLLTPIQALRPIVAAHANSQTNLTRPDIWALAAAVGADVLQTDVRVDFNMVSVGRVTCEKANTVCRNGKGVQQACSDVLGPHRVVPGMNINSHDLFDFFAVQFGFSIKETVAIMGTHTVGQLRKDEVGVDGPNGWLLENEVFDNGKLDLVFCRNSCQSV
jgi:Peroxidase